MRRLIPTVRPAAIVYCEGHFAGLDGKTAHGLVRYCEAYTISAVIDSYCAGMDAGIFLDGVFSGIPIVCSLEEAQDLPGAAPDTFIYGMAPADGLFRVEDLQMLRNAMAAGLNLVSGMREFLTDDPEFVAVAARHQVTIRDVRRPAPSRISSCSMDQSAGRAACASLCWAPMARSGNEPLQPCLCRRFRPMASRQCL